MIRDLVETEKTECGADSCNRPSVYIEEKLQCEQTRGAEYDAGSCQDIIILEQDNIRYEIYGICHTPDPVTWRSSHRRQEISLEADAAYKYPSNLVFAEEDLLSCRKAEVLEDIQYALNSLSKKKDYFRDEGAHISERQQIQKSFMDKMDEYFNATDAIVRAILSNSAGLSPKNRMSYLAYFSRAILLPQPIGMESNLLYLESYLRTHDKNNPKTRCIYTGLTPARPAYITKKLREAAEYPGAKQIRLYCGIGHIDEVAFLLKNRDYIDRYLTV